MFRHFCALPTLCFARSNCPLFSVLLPSFRRGCGGVVSASASPPHIALLFCFLSASFCVAPTVRHVALFSAVSAFTLAIAGVGYTKWIDGHDAVSDFLCQSPSPTRPRDHCDFCAMMVLCYFLNSAPTRPSASCDTPQNALTCCCALRIAFGPADPRPPCGVAGSLHHVLRQADDCGGALELVRSTRV